MKRIFNTVATLWRGGRTNFPKKDAHSTYRRLHFYTVSCMHLACLHRWLHCEVPPALQTELQRSSLLLKVLTKPYINRRWGFQKRAHMIATHYRLVGVLDLPFFNFPDDQYWNCTQFELDQRPFRIVIDRPSWMRSEGEVCVSLFAGVDRLYSLAFSIGGTADSPRLLVGAIQGAADVVDGSLYSNITKLFHGIRPRDMMVHIVKIMAQHVGCTELWAVSDACHQSVGRGNQFARASKYDGIWLENGGTPNDAGFFVMCTTLHRRADEDIPARKRALYRRRYALLGTLAENIKLAFASEHKDSRLHGL